ncbi:MAG: hypothetical protein NUV67_03540 [archaeon]|nr:hypothetical protein [archaeon]
MPTVKRVHFPSRASGMSTREREIVGDAARITSAHSTEGKREWTMGEIEGYYWQSGHPDAQKKATLKEWLGQTKDPKIRAKISGLLAKFK